ncbi:quinoprotein relay system zinc metallohydrolase 1 [Novosphingobium mangrovi (ex Huang et al. 2023)]|uniref:Quinoprotein relay system zinc metallohydrolase 1 n=1 Tax=Novosphingobium mangrovi (ex Huang et al. 2023) TaxID=2976432 RepID=A0ABT2I279_9SPHN|nr:quinoprotein relay system zinc metallohydrolase 1 [Novosphingobium mangrovi (ex Huang et al. 2023)]MCT2398758.1 quinoprotein relay system zinc metallohydrolase 1 [Novosphingobium mangrovi (ex Huang et al. 2023)]
MMLTRRAMLGAALALPVAARAEQFAGRYEPRAEPIADGLWMVRGADAPIEFGNGGAIANSALIATEAGTVLFDPGVSLTHGQALAALALQVTGIPVARVYVSHLHPDHAFGAAAFDPWIVHALPATRKELERDGEGLSDAMYDLLADWMKGTNLVLPLGDVAAGDATFGGRDFRMFALSGHSGGDLALLDRRTGTLIAGDLVFHDRAPSTPHADLPSWRAALDVLEATPHKLLLPGHGPLDTDHTAITQTRDWLDWIDATLRKAVAGGLSMAEAGDIAIPGRFARLKAARYEWQRSVSHFYPGLEEELLPRLQEIRP